MKRFVPGILALLVLAVNAPAFAQADFSTISKNIITSVQDTPGVISGVSYLLGLLLGILGIVHVKRHVMEPRQNELKDAVVRLLAGGALFALPTVYEAAVNTISGGAVASGLPGVMGDTDGMTLYGAISGEGFNQVFQNIVTSLQDTPGLISGLGYLMGLVMGVTGILQLKDHVMSPERVPLRSGVIRLLAAGSLFALTTIFSAMWQTINGGTDTETLLSSLAGSMSTSTEAAGYSCNTGTGG